MTSRPHARRPETAEELQRTTNAELKHAIATLEHALHLARALQSRCITDPAYATRLQTAGLTEELTEKAWDARYAFNEAELERKLEEYESYA